MMLSVQQARELLGDEAVGMTDSQVQDLVALVEGLADIIIDTYIGEHCAAVQPTAFVQCAA